MKSYFLVSCLDKFPQFKKFQSRNHFDSNWLQLSRGRIRYTRHGSADAAFTVVLMPDPPNTIEHMSELISLLEKDFQVVVFEGLGFGYSQAGLKHDFSMLHCADVISDLVHKLELNNVILGLTCAAALPGLLVAKKYPDRVVGLVLGQVPAVDEAKKWASRVDFKNIMGTPFVGQLMLRALRNKVSESWYMNAFPRGYDIEKVKQMTFQSYKNGARFSLASQFQALLADATSDIELYITQPAIVLWGMLDRSHKKTDKYKTLDLLENGEVWELDDCGHFPDIEKPEVFMQAVVDVSERAQSDA